MLPEQRLHDMFTSNDDGAGFMFVRGGKVIIRKGFMKFKHLLKGIAEENLTKDDLIIFHFRIATAGSVSPKNTHPFPVTNNVKQLQALRTETDLAVAHNGILSYEVDKKLDLSDTMTFIRDVVAEKPVRDNIQETSVWSLLEMSVGSSRLVFVNGDGDYALIGDWLEDKVANDGCSYSNLTFRWKTTQTTFQETGMDFRDYRGGQGIHTVEPIRQSGVTHYGSEHLDTNSVQVFAGEERCPKCKTLIQGRGIFCTKCGVLFERDDMSY